MIFKATKNGIFTRLSFPKLPSPIPKGEREIYKMMEKVSDFYDRLVMTQVCVRKPVAAVLSHGRVHTLWPALPFCESQPKFS